MVVADQALATDVGVAVLRDGGNAVDAAVADGVRAGGRAIRAPATSAAAASWSCAWPTAGSGARLPRDRAGAPRAATCTSTRRRAPTTSRDRPPGRRRARRGRRAVGGAPDVRHEALGRGLAPAIRLARDGLRRRRLRSPASSLPTPDASSRFDGDAPPSRPAASRSPPGARSSNPELARDARAHRRGRAATASTRARPRDADRGRDAARRRPHHARGPRALPGEVARRRSRSQYRGYDGDLHAAAVVGRDHAGR